ncbi:MAG: DUF971 domain-containing protein [Gammaproteobacteria bacterium]|nr:DUF971 domain-containing protein [Gammaproteobacteria bacterium]
MTPTSITYHKGSKTLEVQFSDGVTAELTAEALRVFSPSAEVRGHSPEQSVLQTGKKHVSIDKIEAIGNYAIRIMFDDGHDTGIYSWDYLRELHDTFDEHWTKYVEELTKANASRLPAIPVGHWSPSKT